MFSELLEDECPFLLSQGKGEDKKWQGRKKFVVEITPYYYEHGVCLEMLIIMLMLIGGSPGSTAGGMKTTTLAVLVSSALSVFRKKEHTNFFGRQIPDDTIRNAATIFLMYIVLFLVGGMVISRTEDIPLMTALFETASAIGTVGLSLGITPDLGFVSHIILICLMFFGRVGGLTLIFATISEKKPNGSKYPQEKITVG